MTAAMPLRRIGALVVTGSLALGMAACSRGYKTGSAISAQDVVKAMPEFVVKLPPSGAWLYLEQASQPPLASAWLKVTVPRASLTNFLSGYGFASEFISVDPQTLRLQRELALPAGMDTRSAGAWLSAMPRNVRHAAEWDLGKTGVTMRMYITARPGISPNDQVILTAYVNTLGSRQPTVYLEYWRLTR